MLEQEFISPRARSMSFLCCAFGEPCGKSDAEHLRLARVIDQSLRGTLRFLVRLHRMMDEDLCALDLERGREVFNHANMRGWTESVEYQILDLTPVSEHQGDWIYFIQSKEYVKIGLSSNVEARLRSLQTASPYPLKLLRKLAVPNASIAEVRLHAYFASKRVTGEWFALSDNDIDEVMWMNPTDLEHLKPVPEVDNLPLTRAEVIEDEVLSASEVMP